MNAFPSAPRKTLVVADIHGQAALLEQLIARLPIDWMADDTRELRPAGWCIVCTDLSPGMAAEARSELAGEAGLSFAAADAQALPFPDESFDVVLANFMLYHVPDRPRALAEIRRVLRSGRQFAAATVGRTHMGGMRELVLRFVPDLPPEAVAQSQHFLLENAVA